jgi:predicted small secreted protein
METNFDEVHSKFDNSDIKFLKIFVLFTAIIITTQILQFINTKIIDSKYSKHLVEKHEVINATQTALIQSSRIQRALVNMAIATDSLEKENLNKRILSSAKKNEEALASIDTKKVFLHISDSLITSIKQANKEYQNIYQTYLQLITTSERDKAIEYKNTTLRPALETYQELQQKLLIKISTEAIAENKTTREYANVSCWVLFIIGLSPYIYIVSALIYMIIKKQYFRTKQN